VFLIPLNQAESVDLVIHALKAAGGEADCSQCPARLVCMKQCLSIAAAVERMVANGTLPALEPDGSEPPEGGGTPSPQGGGRLKVVK